MTSLKLFKVVSKSYVALVELFVFVIPSPCLSVRVLTTDSNWISCNAKKTTTNTQHIQKAQSHDLTLGRTSCYIACVAWRFGFWVCWKGAMKPRVLLARSGEAARNRLPGWPAFFIAAPITYFDNPMTGLVNCNKKFPAIKTNYPMRCLLDMPRSLWKEEIERNVNDNCRLCCSLKIKFGEFKHYHAKPYQGLQVWRISKLHFVRNLKLA